MTSTILLMTDEWHRVIIIHFTNLYTDNTAYIFTISLAISRNGYNFYVKSNFYITKFVNPKKIIELITLPII